MIDITSKDKGYFWTALQNAQPGDSIVYARGSHCASVHKHDAMIASHKGLASLVQKRNGPGDYTYIAQKRKKRTQQ